MATITLHVAVNEEDDGSFWAEVEELKGCFASGFSMEELKEAAEEAIQLWLPEGIKLENPRWQMVEDKPRRSRVHRKPPTHSRREMLICA